MLVSMTGYGQAFFENDHFKISVEMKSINHRFSEITIRMPRQFLFIEDTLKKTISKYVQRGKVDVFVSVEGEGLVQRTLQVDWDLLNEYYRIHNEAKETLRIDQQLSLERLLLQPDIVTVQEKETNNEFLIEQLKAVTEKAALELLKMRQKEGSSLATDFLSRIEKLSLIASDIESHAPKVVTNYEQRLTKRLEDFLSGKIEIDETRLITEVAIFADKASVDEELTRLKSHFEQFIMIINESNQAVGRKLDFLVQEMNREANTIGSKSNDIHINKQVVELKAELEKIKEQVQNIE